MKYAETTTTHNGRRTRQTCGFCLPVSQESTGIPVFWWVDRAKYNTLRGNTPSRLCAVVETRRPLSRAVTTKHIGPTMHTPQSRHEFYTQAAAANLQLIEDINSHYKRLQALHLKLIDATADLVAVLGNEIAADRDADRESDL